MRKTSYFVAFLAVTVTFLLNVLSIRRPDWLVVASPKFLGSKTTIQYGLTQRCERQVLRVPVPDGSEIVHSAYKCRAFPARVADSCEEENKYFCVVWTTAGYLSELGAGFAAVSCLALFFGVTTHSRRRRIWRAVAVLVALHAASLIATFAIVTDTYSNAAMPGFEQARPGVAYILGTLAWIFAIFVTFGVVVTGVAANRGHRWAAGNRAYRPIQG